MKNNNKQHKMDNKLDYTQKWHIKLSTTDTAAFQLLKDLIKACKVPTLILAASPKAFFLQYTMLWDGEKMNDMLGSPSMHSTALTLQQALQWLTAYVPPPAKPKFKIVDVDNDGWLSVGSLYTRQGQCVDYLQYKAYKSGVAIVDSTDHTKQVGWIPVQDFNLIHEAIKELQKQ